jgi:hypothetical protein
MGCLLFVEGADCRCFAVLGRHVPTLHERERYCRTSDPGRCPTLREFVDRGTRLSEEQYLQIWIPPEPVVSNAYTSTRPDV